MGYVQAVAQQIREKIKELSEINIVSLAIFGSVARQAYDEDSDIDLLAVAEGIAEERIQRIPDMVEIKRRLDLGVPLDILLVHKDECILNFRSHNPLYLDIALDAEIVYDDNGFLGDLIKETREYIISNNIQREEDGWSFPVKRRTATKLSDITNKEWALVWLADGKRDLLAASYLRGASLFEKSVYHCQQAVEKGTKAILAAWGKFRRTHAVADTLRSECKKQDVGEWEERIMEIADIGNTIEPHVSLSRYPRLADGTLWLPQKRYDAIIAEEYLEKARIVIATSEEFIQWWFK